MILTSTTEEIEFVPPWRENDIAAPKFKLRAASVIERGQMEAEVAGTYQAASVMPWDLRAACVDGVNALLDGDPAQHQVLALIEAEAAGDGEPLAGDELRLIEEVRKVLAEHWPPYRDLIAQMERRRALLPIVALRRFCTGIEAKGVTFSRDRTGQVSEATLAQLDPLEMTMAGSRAYALAYGADAEKNLPPPSLSGDGPATSVSDATSKVAGRSARRSGKKIPG